MGQFILDYNYRTSWGLVNKGRSLYMKKLDEYRTALE